MAVIRTENLTKKYGDITAVQNLDLTVEAGEIFGFLGPNGAGKSTTIDLLLGFTSPTAGQASVLGTETTGDPRMLRQNIGILSDDYALYDQLTGRDHLKTMIQLKNADDDPTQLLETVGLKQRDHDRPAGEYSKGMQQRLVLATALAGDLDLLILDEPTSGLDPTGIAEIRSIVREQAATGTTVFFSSHHLTEVEAVCDRVGIMNEGQLVAVDTVDELQTQTGGAERVQMAVDQERTDELLPQVRAVEGVVEATADQGTLAVTCQEPPAKARAIETVARETTVYDFTVETPSLEDLFELYTSHSPPPSEPASPPNRTATSAPGGDKG